MSKLLRANLVLVRKDVIFLFSVLAMFAYGVYNTLSLYDDKVLYTQEITPDMTFGAYIIPVCILCAAFCCVFCGEEYSCGTVRNKITVGHSRSAVYFSQFLTCFIAGMAMCLAYIIPSTVLGIVVLGGYQKSVTELLAYLVCGFLLVMSCVSFYCLIMTLIPKRGAGTAVTMIIILVVANWAILVKQTLNLPEFTYRYLPETNTMSEKMLPNPRYPTGAYRTFLENLYDFLPAGQAWQISNMLSEALLRLMIFSSVFTVLCMLAGITIFRKKDLK